MLDRSWLLIHKKRGRVKNALDALILVTAAQEKLFLDFFYFC